MFHSKISCFGSSLDASEKEIKEFKGVRIEKGLNVDGFKFFRMLGKGAYAKVRVAAKKILVNYLLLSATISNTLLIKKP